MLGDLVECVNCGAELLVEEPPADAEPEAEDTQTLEERLAGTDTAPSPAATSFEALSGGGPPSSFTGPSESETSRPRSPFEGEDAEPVEEGMEAVFGPEGELDAKVRPPERFGPVFIETESGLDKKTGERCAECGRTIRGDWDRFKFEEGVICYVCSNQGTHGVPERVLTREERREFDEKDMLIEKQSEPDVPMAPWYLNPQSEEFKRVVMGLALLTMGVALFVYLFVDSPEPAGRVVQDGAGAEPVQIPMFVQVIVWTWRIFAVYFGVFLTIYLVLDRRNGLPYDSFKKNMGYIGIVLLVFTGIEAVTLILWQMMSGILAAGAVSVRGILLGPASFFAHVIVMNRMLDYRLSDYVWSFIYFALVQTLMQSMGLFLYWALYQAVS